MKDNDYEYSYKEERDDYCYPNSNILVNKLNIKNPMKLSEVEKNITFSNFAGLVESPIKGKFDFKHLQAIHKHIFKDIYSWAGQIRKGEFLIKGDTVFCRGQYINNCADKIFNDLKADKYLKGLDKNEFIKKVAYYMGEINALHPFREGNGRTQRAFFRQLAKEANYKIDFSKIEKEDLLYADVEAFYKNYTPLENILREITQEIKSSI